MWYLWIKDNFLEVTKWNEHCPGPLPGHHGQCVSPAWALLSYSLFLKCYGNFCSAYLTKLSWSSNAVSNCNNINYCRNTTILTVWALWIVLCLESACFYSSSERQIN
jgi:hypothetical protein